jgi:hypothetical protein
VIRLESVRQPAKALGDLHEIARYRHMFGGADGWRKPTVAVQQRRA